MSFLKSKRLGWYWNVEARMRPGVPLDRIMGAMVAVCPPEDLCSQPSSHGDSLTSMAFHSRWTAGRLLAKTR